MSDQEVLFGKRRINRLSLDSEEEARVEAEEQQRQEEIRKKKEEKRKRREEEAQRVEEEARKQKELERHYEDPQTMLEPDSDSDDQFERAEKKIRKAYPDIKPPRQQTSHKRRHHSSSEESEEQDSEDEDSEGSEEESSESHKKKKEKKAKKERKREESQEIRARHKSEKVKIQQKDPKEILVGQIAIRWWYCLPAWPPADFDYEAELKKQGYRIVEANRFRMEQNLVNGLFKAMPIDGYIGLFRSKQKIIDARPKQFCPSLQFLRNKTIEELTGLLRTALKQQINTLNSQKYQGSDDLELISKLTKRLNQIS